MFEQVRGDYNRHYRSILNPALWVILNYRFGRWAFAIRLTPLRWFASKIYGLNKFFILITSGDILNRETKIGKDFHIIHAGMVKIGSGVVIGDRCGIQHGVTLGINTQKDGVPIIGNDVYIGTGAVIIGGITIGDNARVAANSLVISDVPANATAIGVPARMMRYTGRCSTEEKRGQENTDQQDTLKEE